ncbi:DUF4367 domain-containing protein [Clostridium weizhouense]|uniref:DUF4367 domain-containing protein n=1 Tax=Clostridium weizhouense TaxID=2859781 RepID=A0ABS7AQ20_9CLOT|nr:DUF4367 domain-containing protein [Clostridium weizhouense]MBW6410768.1 DUF4367 domain-containing protein [Clostridium weizhouense]
MSKNYKDVMNKIVMDEDMKNRILSNVNNVNEKEDNVKVKRLSNRIFSNLVMYAACFSIVLFSITNNTFIKLFKFGEPDLQQMNVSKNINITEKTDNSDELKNKDLESRERKEDTEEKINSTNTDSSLNKENENNQIKRSNVNEPINQEGNESKVPLKNDKFNEKSINSQNNLLDNENVKNTPYSSPEPKMQSNASSQLVRTILNERNFESLTELKKAVDFEFKIPKKLPPNFKIDTISYIENSVVSITYSNKVDNSSINFRTSKKDKDISGDYTQYKLEKIINFDETNISLSGDKSLINLAKWNKDNISYSILTKNGLGEEEILDIVKNIDISK